MSETAENTLEPFGFQRDTDYAKITEPLKGDLLNRKPLAEHLTRYIDRLPVGAVLALDARWGEGKTWFVQNWKAHLEQTETKHNVIYLNAFAQDYLEDPFMVLAAEISHAFDTANDKHPLIQSFKDQAINATKALLPELPKLMLSLGITLMGAGYLGKTLENAVSTAQDAINTTKETYGDEMFDGINETINENIQEAIKERFEKHETDKQTLESFKQSLRALANDEDLNPKPLVFIIDELDRCNPLFSVRLIERIKHFFDIPNIVFVLVTDKTQLQATICHQFGYNEAASEAYLDKFIDFTIKLSTPLKIGNAYKQHIQEKLHNLGLPLEMAEEALIYTTVFNKSIRQVNKILNEFSLLFFQNNQDLNGFLLFKLFQPKTNSNENILIFSHICHTFFKYALANDLNDYKIDVSEFEAGYQANKFNSSLYQENSIYDKLSIACQNNPTSRISLKFLDLYSNYQQMVSTTPTPALRDQIYNREYHELMQFKQRLVQEFSIYNPTNQQLSSIDKVNDTWNQYIKTGLNE